VDHKLSSNTDEKQRIRGSGIKLSDNQMRLPGVGLSVSRALGDFFAKEVNSGLIAEPYVHPTFAINPETDSFLIVASDGLWDVIQPQQAMDLVKHMNNSKDMAECLVQTALKSYLCEDNITVIVVRL